MLVLYSYCMQCFPSFGVIGSVLSILQVTSSIHWIDLLRQKASTEMPKDALAVHRLVVPSSIHLIDSLRQEAGIEMLKDALPVHRLLRQEAGGGQHGHTSVLQLLRDHLV